MDVEADAAGKCLLLLQPPYPLPGGVPEIGRHLKQGQNVLLTGQVDDLFYMPHLHLVKALVGHLLYLVYIRPVVEDLLQLPQMLFRRHHIQKPAALFQNSVKFLCRHG